MEEAIADIGTSFRRDFRDLLGWAGFVPADGLGAFNHLVHLIQQRQSYRKLGMFPEADKIRDELKIWGIELVDDFKLGCLIGTWWGFVDRPVDMPMWDFASPIERMLYYPHRFGVKP